jgi:hypothetical protein
LKTNRLSHTPVSTRTHNPNKQARREKLEKQKAKHSQGPASCVRLSRLRVSCFKFSQVSASVHSLHKAAIKSSWKMCAWPVGAGAG